MNATGADRSYSKWRAVLIAAVSVVSLSGCAGTPGVLVGAHDNTLFAKDDSPNLLMFMDGDRGTEVRTLRGEYVRTILPNLGISDTDDRGLHVVGRDDAGAFRTVAGASIHRLPLPIEWSAHLTLNGPGTRIAATSGPGGQMRILSFDAGEVLLSRDCPAAASCFWVAWDLQDPNVLWFLGRTHDGYVRLNFESGETALVSRDVSPPIRLPTQNAVWQTVCKDSGAKLIVTRDAIDLAESGQPPRRVAVVEGFRPRWGQERIPPIGSAGFLEGCRYVVFSYLSGYYLLEVATGSIGRLPGVPLRSLPSAATESSMSFGYSATPHREVTSLGRRKVG